MKPKNVDLSVLKYIQFYSNIVRFIYVAVFSAIGGGF